MHGAAVPPFLALLAHQRHALAWFDREERVLPEAYRLAVPALTLDLEAIAVQRDNLAEAPPSYSRYRHPEFDTMHRPRMISVRASYACNPEESGRDFTQAPR